MLIAVGAVSGMTTMSALGAHLYGESRGFRGSCLATLGGLFAGYFLAGGLTDALASPSNEFGAVAFTSYFVLPALGAVHGSGPHRS